jgi:RNA polymerase sigma-70 factor (ECF subfamily)
MNLSEIYQLYGSMVYNLALQYTQNVEDAEEITQDVFLIVHEKIDSFRGEASLKTWIYRLSINKSLDYIKAKKSKKRWSFFSSGRVDAGEIEIPDQGFNHPGVEMEQRESMEHLFKLINQLSENQKTVIILLKVDGLTMEEVGDIMELSYKAVESLFQRAKKNLKILIENSKENEK